MVSLERVLYQGAPFFCISFISIFQILLMYLSSQFLISPRAVSIPQLYKSSALSLDHGGPEDEDDDDYYYHYDYYYYYYYYHNFNYVGVYFHP